MNLALKLPFLSVNASMLRVMPAVLTLTVTLTALSGRLVSTSKAVPVISMGVPAGATSVTVVTVA